MFCKFFLLMALQILALNLKSQEQSLPALIIHGGAGNIEKQNISDSAETAIRAALQTALDSGYAVLDRGGAALEAIEKAIVLLENNPRFNAGKGAVMTLDGHHELDASVMDGADLQAGAVAGVKNVKNPVKAAIAVMKHSPHVLLSGDGADAFARAQGLEMVPNSYFTTERIQNIWERQQRRGDNDLGKGEFSKFGTVGAVAIDKEGNIAAATSTGGMMNKSFGRIGDSPIIGAGTYADNSTCGVSCTGHGEYFIRIGVAKEVSDRMKFGGSSLKEAAEMTINQKLEEMGGQGGLIAIDKDGNIFQTFNTKGMFRGWINASGSKTALYGDE